MAKRNKYEQILTDGVELISFYNNHPCVAVYDIFRVDLAPIQRLIFRDLWFKNYNIMVCSRGAGKSVSTDSLSFIDGLGLVYLNEVLPKVPEYLNDGDEEIINFDKGLFTNEGIKRTKRLCLEKNIIGKELITESLFNIKGSNHHPILVPEQGEFSYKRLSNFNLGEDVYIQIGQAIFGNSSFDEIEAYSLGIFASDEIPYDIRVSNFETQTSFLRGYLECNCLVDDYGFTIEDKSLKLLKELQLMLLNFGIVSSIKSNELINQLNINGEYLNRFNDLYLGNFKKDDIKVEYFIDKVKHIYNWQGDCYDFEMETDTEPNYFANGFINHNTFLLGLLAALSGLLIPGYRIGLLSSVFRQSKNIFAEVEKLYNQSSIFREACAKKPVHATDSHHLKFKVVGGMTPSYIEALPLGNGEKIRGSRFYLLIIDEAAQVPNFILDTVIRPMAATSLAPMERVRRHEHRLKLIESGVASESDFQEESSNKMVLANSGTYKFNHLWNRMRDYWSQIDKDALEGRTTEYSVWQVPYWDLPEMFLDMKSIEEAKRNMPESEFAMEYEAKIISDSEGFFKASLLEGCTTNSGHSIEVVGKKESEYIIGIDPNQGGKASTGIVVIKLGNIRRIVNVIELKDADTISLTKFTQDICENYNTVRLFVDKGGGGKALSDLLREGYNNKLPILDKDDPENKHKEGLHILNLVNFSPGWISDANFSIKAMLEDKRLLFPEIPLGSTSDIEAKRYEASNLLKRQMSNIVVTQTSTGLLHFDTPTKGQNKDLYSAILLAGYGSKLLEVEEAAEDEPILYNSGGVINLRDGRGFNSLVGQNLKVNNDYLNSAVLKKK